MLLHRVHRDKTIKWLFSYIFDYFFQYWFFQNDVFISGAPTIKWLLWCNFDYYQNVIFVSGADKGGSCPAISCSGHLLSQSKILSSMNIFSADSNSMKTLFIYSWLFFSEWKYSYQVLTKEFYGSGALWADWLLGPICRRQGKTLQFYKII